MTLSFTPSGIRVVERCTRYIDVSAENGGQALDDVELSSTNGAGAAGNADVVIVKKPEKKKGWSFTTWLLVISVGLGIVGGLGYYGSTILFASSSDSSTTNAESPAPPAPPGASYVPAVRLTTVVAGTVADLDQNAYKNNLAGLLGADVQASDITLVVSAGSVVVEAIITTDTDAGADSIMSNLNQYDQTTLGQALQNLDCLIPGNPSNPNNPIIIEYNGVAYDATGSGAFQNWNSPLWSCSNDCNYDNPCNTLLSSQSQCNEVVNLGDPVNTQCSTDISGSPGDYPEFCHKGTDCTNCGIWAPSFRYRLQDGLNTEYYIDRSGNYEYNVLGFYCCDANIVGWNTGCDYSPPPSPPSPPPSPLPPADLSLVDRSCADNVPGGNPFICFDDASRGWDPDNNVASSSVTCDITEDTNSWTGVVSGHCNEQGNQGGSTENCERGYDCKYCGVRVWNAGRTELNMVWGTQCSDEGSGCISRINTFDCCSKLCQHRSITGIGCQVCSR